MSTAVAKVEPRTALATTGGEPSFPELVDMGKHLVGTGFLPDHIKNGAQAAAIILAGRELGMPPMRALRSLVLVKGKVTEYADSQLSRFKADGGHATFTTLTDAAAHLVLTHPNGDKHTEVFTAEDARKAGLLSNQNYNKFPKAMLRSRAITAGLKSIGWEGGAGVYDPAELAPVEAEPVQVEDADVVQDGDAPTDKQREFLSKLMRSHVFTEAERSRMEVGATSKQRAKDAIEWAQKQITKRKAAEADDAEAVFSGARVGMSLAPADIGDDALPITPITPRATLDEEIAA